MKKIIILFSSVIGLFAISYSCQAKSKDFILQTVTGSCENCNYLYKLEKFQFLDYYNGFASGYYLPDVGQGSGISTMFRTVDGGHTWEQIKFIEQAGAENPPTFYFVTSNQGWVSWIGITDAQCHFIHTTDGGKTWQELQKPSAGVLKHVTFFDEREGHAIEYRPFDGYYFATTINGGLSWLYDKLPFNYVYYMVFFNHQKGIILGMSDKLSMLKTENDGKSWKMMDINISKSGYLRNSFWSNPEKGWMIIWSSNNEGSYLFQTLDGGISWNQHLDTSFQGNNIFLDIVSFVSENTGFIFLTEKITTKENRNNSYLLYTKNAGKDWKKFSINQLVSYCQVFQNELLCNTDGLDILKINSTLSH